MKTGNDVAWWSSSDTQNVMASLIVSAKIDSVDFITSSMLPLSAPCWWFLLGLLGVKENDAGRMEVHPMGAGKNTDIVIFE